MNSPSKNTGNGRQSDQKTAQGKISPVEYDEHGHVLILS